MKQEVYMEVANHIKRFILLGIYDNDSLLPPCRKLALELGVNPNTVMKAYEYLEGEGIVYSVPKKGYVISQQKNDSNKEKDVLKKTLQNLLEMGFSKEEIMKELQKENDHDQN